MTTMEGLERYEGHLLNWYDTSTLAPLPPRYVSTVDSGNLAGALIALAEGLQAARRRRRSRRRSAGPACATPPRSRGRARCAPPSAGATPPARPAGVAVDRPAEHAERRRRMPEESLDARRRACVPELVEALDVRRGRRGRTGPSPGRGGPLAAALAEARRPAPAGAAAHASTALARARAGLRGRHGLRLPLRPAAADLRDRLPARRRRGPWPPRSVVLRPARLGGAARELRRHRQGRRPRQPLVPPRAAC